MRLLLLVAVPLILYFVIQAKAQEQMPLPGNAAAGRFTLQPSGDQFLRMDSQSGEVSVCARKLDEWVCEEVADAAAAKDEEIARLTRENARLRERIAGLDSEAPQTSDEGKIELPTKQDLDKVMGFFEDVMKRFNEMVKRLDEQPQPQPEKQKI